MEIKNNEIRKNLVLSLAKIQVYTFSSISSNIQYSDKMVRAGFLCSRIFQALSEPCLFNYFEDKRPEHFEKSYLFLIEEIDKFLSEINDALTSVTLQTSAKWDSLSEEFAEKINLPEQTSIIEKKIEADSEW